MGANRSGKRLGGFPLVRTDARLRAGQDHRRLRLAVYVLCTAWGDASSPAASERFVPVVCGLTRPAMFSCRGNLPRDRTQRAGDGPVSWPGPLPGPWFLARVLPEARCQGWLKDISEGNAKRP